jgi:hypothetical protein
MTALTFDEDIVDLSAHEVEEEDDDDERWHVQLAPGDVRVLSIDQLDDMYRLDVIDDQTMVWKDGMGSWSPLGVVLAGDDDDGPVDPFGTPSFAPAPLAPVSFAPAPLAPISSGPLPSFAPAPLAPVSFAPAPLAPVSFAPAPLAPIASAALPSFAPAPLAPVSRFAPTTPPVAFSIPAPPPRAGAGERWLVGLAIACGLFATLHRNDVLSQVAHSAKQDAPFAQAEQRLLGGPGFGTVRSVEALLDENGLRLPAVRIPLAVETAAAAAPAAAAESVAAPAAAAPAAKSPEAPKPAPVAEPSKVPEATTNTVAGALRGKRAEPRPAAPARAKSLPAPSKKQGDSVIPGSRPTRGRSAEYDPLNGNL